MVLGSVHNFDDNLTNIGKIFRVGVRASTCDNQIRVLWMSRDDWLLISSHSIPSMVSYGLRQGIQLIFLPPGMYGPDSRTALLEVWYPPPYPITSIQHRFDS